MPGGVVAVDRSPEGQVAVVIGGGSGHYPAFAGLVGQGLAHGAAMGNLFASPSTQQVYSVARAADQGGGVLLSYGNYAGDVLNFDAAQEQLRAEGIDCETVTVTDDISSAPVAEKHKRRGIAGDLTVFKVAGAAAEAGYDLDGRRAGRAAARTSAPARSASRSPAARCPARESRCSPCPRAGWPSAWASTASPASTRPRSRPPTGSPSCSSSRLLEEVPDGVEAPGARVVPILNGLGGVKYEELFVVYRRVDRLLREAGIEVVDPQVGEFCTSFDMAGHLAHPASGSDERARAALVRAGRHPRLPPRLGRRRERVDVTDQPRPTPSRGRSRRRATSPARRPSGDRAPLRRRGGRALDEHVDELGRLDAIAGDGDHGIGMQRGSHAAGDAAARAAVDGRRGRRDRCSPQAGDAWSDTAGGTSGALWGVALRALGGAVGDDDAPRRPRRRRRRSRPAARRHRWTSARPRSATRPWSTCSCRSCDDLTPRRRRRRLPARGLAARRRRRGAAAAATADLLPRMGRARPHGEKSLGTPDPGALSFALIATTVAGELARAADGDG